MFDLNSIKEADSADIEILHPITRAPTGAKVTLMGPEHPARKRVQFDLQRKLRTTLAKKGRFDVGDPEEEERQEIDRLAAFTLGWQGIGVDGKEIAFSKEAAADLYAKPEMAWLRRQLQAGLGDLENFIRNSAGG